MAANRPPDKCKLQMRLPIAPALPQHPNAREIGGVIEQTGQLDRALLRGQSKSKYWRTGRQTAPQLNRGRIDLEMERIDQGLSVKEADLCAQFVYLRPRWRRQKARIQKACFPADRRSLQRPGPRDRPRHAVHVRRQRAIR